MKITNDIVYIGTDDHEIDLFEGHYIVPNGMAYNSYVILDGKIAVMDTMEARFSQVWLDNLENALGGRKPDYLIVQHMEPDHSASIVQFMTRYPEATVVSSAFAFTMMKNFYGTDFTDRRRIVGDGDTLQLGKHTLHFIAAPMVHWPEVTMTYDDADQVLFSADGFGKFGALDTVDEEGWACEARRYYFGIVGKFGEQVQAVLKKASALDIRVICPLHGPVLDGQLEEYFRLYETWSSYGTETEGVLIAYTSVYGHTKTAALLLADKLKARGCPKVQIRDLAREDIAEAVEDAFRYGKIVLATTTYNGGIFPYMREFIASLTERGYQNKLIGLIENGSWAPAAAGIMRGMFDGCKNLTFAKTTVKITSALNPASSGQLDELADEMWKGGPESIYDTGAMFRLGYGLYAVTTSDGKKDNGMIANAVTQITSTPNRVAVCINKQNYSCHVIRQTGKMNLNCLSVDATFDVFQRYGFQSGRNADKFEGVEIKRSGNGIAYLPEHINAYLSLEVEEEIDCETHMLFICAVSEAKIINKKESMTYAYYQANVKPKPEAKPKKGWVCKVCGYVYEGDELPSDFTCPICKHGPESFEKTGD